MEELGILYYVDLFPKLSESFILNEINELEKRGHNVAVFSQNDPEENVLHKEYGELDVPVYYADISYGDLSQVISKKVLQMAVKNPEFLSLSTFSPKEVGQTFLLGKQCAEFIERISFEIDIINGHFASLSKIGAIHAATYHNIPCVVTAHAAEIFKSPNIGQIKHICNGMDHVIVPSDYNRQYLQEVIKITNGITIVPATTEIKKFETPDNTVENRLLTVGRLVEKKGHEYAIDAVNRLINQGYNIEYHIVGTGDREKLLRQQVQEYGIGEYVNFLGHISDERLQKELSEASVFLLPCVIAEDGDRDAMPVALKEAMASRTACVSTTVSAIPELITDAYDGILVPPRDPELLAQKLQKLLDNPEMRESLAKNGSRTVRDRFDISNSVDTLLNVFASAD
ncbi:glycosyltransferase [Halomontanus rarus]|uniref:glycosyltransferase n=1 Tax=Halomontanus rarus TaxID=3034020 RepID=UPI0023E7A510|nr:glycosyltransferase [Halovivax sp. TS33]